MKQATVRGEKGKAMSRYIDADALIEAMGEEPYLWTDSAEEIAERNQWLTDIYIIESAPNIDIVKCKECIWRDTDNQDEDYCMYVKGLSDINESSFCSWGERKEKCKECWYWSEVHKRCENKYGCQFKPYGEREGE